MFLVSLSYQAPLPEVDAHLSGHRDYLDRFMKRGIFLFAGRKVPRTGGVILAKTADRKSLDEIVQEDPFVAHGLASYEITELQITKSALDFPS